MMRARAFVPVVLLAVLTAGGHGTAQQTPPATDPPSFRSSINFVEVDVIVHGRDSQPVADLRQDDFELFEDDKPQPIDQFRLVRPDTPSPDAPAPRAIRGAYDEEVEAAKDGVRLFGIFFDDDSMTDGFAGSVFQGKADVERVRGPLIQFVQSQLRPLDMVATMYATTPLAGVQFTRDRDKTVSEIRRFADELGERRERDERQQLNNPFIPIDRRRALNGLMALAAKMASLREGRKSIIYVGRGVASAYSTSAARGRSDFDELVATLNRGNTALYALSPAGLGTRRGGSTTSLRELSDFTGGFAIVDTNGMSEGLARVAADASTYYLLGYTSPAPADGKFHEINVRVKRPGVTVRSRSGYWSYSAEEAKRASTPAKWVASPVMDALGALASSAETGRRTLRSWVGASKRSDGRPEVTVAWEALPGDAARSPRVAAVTITAKNRAGTEVFSNREVMLPASGAAAAAVRPSGRAAFGAEPGQLQVTVTFEDAAGESVDADVRSFAVPDFSAAAAPVFSTPQVFRAANAREFGLISANPDAVPAIGREFARTDRVLVRFDSYRPNAEPTARVLNRQGNPMFDLPVSRATAGATHQIDMLLSRVPAGDYLIELRSGDASPELIALRVR